MHYPFHVHVITIFPAQVFKPSKTSCASTPLVRSKVTFIDKLQRLQSYVRATKENCGVCFVEVSMLAIVEDMISLDTLVVSSRAIHVWYISVGNMIIKSQGSFFFIRKQERDTLVAKTFVITNLDDPDPYI